MGMDERFIAENESELRQLLTTLCRIPAPSNHEEKRAEFCRDWLISQGAEGVYIDAALNAVYPMNCEGKDDPCLTIMLTVIRYLLQKKLTPKRGILFVADSGEEGLGNLKGIRQVMSDYAGRISEVYAFDGQYDAVVNCPVGSHRYFVEVETEGGHSFRKWRHVK